MKDVFKKSMLIVTCGFVLSAMGVKADAYYTNSNGVEMTELQYYKMTQLFSERKIENLSQDEFDEYKDVTIDDAQTMYQMSIFEDGEFVYEEEISEEEYLIARENEENGVGFYSDTNQTIQTEYKRLAAALYSKSDGTPAVLSSLSWLKMPVYRSYDVYAMRFQYYTHTPSTVFGVQHYYIGNTMGEFTYNSSVANYLGFNSGFGVSMNLKDGSDIDSYELTLATDLTLANTTSNYAFAYVTYQHAQGNLTLAQSQSYELSSGGLGMVLYYPTPSIRNTYDGMSGLQLIKTLN